MLAAGNTGQPSIKGARIAPDRGSCAITANLKGPYFLAVREPAGELLRSNTGFQNEIIHFRDVRESLVAPGTAAASARLTAGDRPLSTEASQMAFERVRRRWQ